MPVAPMPSASEAREAVLEQIRTADSFLLVTHENPDGDALGSLVAMQGVLTALGKDSVMFMAADEFPLPYEYRFFRFDGLISVIPEDLGERTVVFLDCGNIERNPAHDLRQGGPRINIDHHHDNTRFGTINHVVPEASSTSEIVWDLMRSLDVAPTQTIADALYVGLVTDTGRFMYENTSPRAHVMRSTTSSRPALRRATRRGSSTTCAPSLARRSPCSSAISWPRIAVGPARSRCARPTATSTCP